MIYTSLNGSFNFEDYYVIKEVSGLDLPQQKSSKQSVIDRNGDFTFLNGFMNKPLNISLLAIEGKTIEERRTAAIEMKKVISLSGTLVLSFYPVVSYEATVVDGSNINFTGIYDEISLSFDLKPLGKTVLTADGFTWGNTEIPWGQMDNPWGDSFEYAPVAGDTINILNVGNVISTPILKLSGTGDVTFTKGSESFTYTGLETSVFVDVENLIVYNSSNENKIANYDGDFIPLQIGDNLFTITGSFSGLTIEIINKDMYV